MNKLFFFLLTICFCHFISLAQQHKTDSLQHILTTAKADTTKVNALNQLSRELYLRGNYDTAFIHAANAKELAEKLNFRKGIAASYTNIGNVYNSQGNYPEALKNYFVSLKIKEEIGDKQGIAASYTNIGNVYYRQGNYPEAQKNYFAALKIREEIEDKQGIATSYNNIGTVYYRQGSYPEALKNHFASLKIKEEIRDKQGIAASYNNIGLVYYSQGNYPEALKNHFAALKIGEEIGNKQRIEMSYNNIGNVYNSQGNYPEAFKNHFAALKIREEIGDKQGIGMSYNNIGLVYYNQGNYPEALKNHFAALEIREEVGDKQGIAYSYNNIGNVYTVTGKAKEGKEWQEKALKLSKEIGYKEGIKDSYFGLAQADSILTILPLTPLQRRGELAMSALENYKMYVLYKDSLINEESIKKLEREKNKYEYEQEEAKAEAERQRQAAIAEAERRKQQIILWFVIGGLLLVSLFAGFVYRSYRQKQKANTIITQQKAEVEKQKKIIEEKDRDTTDSINYAKRIQQSFLSSERILENCLDDYFILYKPRDIVSGDFYWLFDLPDRTLIACADSTGHGIPGAFMSLIGIGLLNEISHSKKMVEPTDILDELRRIIICGLNPEQADEGGKDGLDIALISVFKSFDADSVKIHFSGAYNSICLVSGQNNSRELKEFKGNKQPVGFYSNMKPFTQEEIIAKKGDIIYMYTDGYRDQFGGEKGKKFMSGQLKKLLLSISMAPLKEQQELLERSFMDWKGDYPQVDDVTVIGIKL